jgi:hypothetical protein
MGRGNDEGKRGKVTNQIFGLLPGISFKGNRSCACLLQVDSRLNQSKGGNPKAKGSVEGRKGRRDE